MLRSGGSQGLLRRLWMQFRTTLPVDSIYLSIDLEQNGDFRRSNTDSVSSRVTSGEELGERLSVCDFFQM